MANLDLSSIRALVVDDNVYMRKIVRTLLVGLGIRTIDEAEDGAVALDKFTSHDPDIIITDWVMPILDGIELTRLIRNPKSKYNCYVPIIMLTGHSEKWRIIEARDAGVTEFLSKPVSAKSLYLRIASCIANPRPFVNKKGYFGPDRRRFKFPNFSGKERRAGNAGEDFTKVDVEAG